MNWNVTRKSILLNTAISKYYSNTILVYSLVFISNITGSINWDHQRIAWLYIKFDLLLKMVSSHLQYKFAFPLCYSYKEICGPSLKNFSLSPNWFLLENFVSKFAKQMKSIPTIDIFSSKFIKLSIPNLNKIFSQKFRIQILWK